MADGRVRLDVLARVVRRARCYRLVTSELDRAVELVLAAADERFPNATDRIPARNG